MAKTSLHRRATIRRRTAETNIDLSLDLDGRGDSTIATGIGFFDHMLTLFAKHAVFDLEIKAQGDLQIDQHHTVEDVGICLGQAIDQSLGDKAGIRRYGDVTLPMDETLITVATDLSGRPFFVWKVAFPTEKIGQFDAQLAEEFWHAVTVQARMNFHVLLHHGQNSHHIAEGIFKAAARALAAACQLDPRIKGVPSTKGRL
jgi:imidazoleglycerol-phosphate dehydratase